MSVLQKYRSGEVAFLVNGLGYQADLAQLDLNG